MKGLDNCCIRQLTILFCQLSLLVREPLRSHRQLPLDNMQQPRTAQSMSDRIVVKILLIELCKNFIFTSTFGTPQKKSTTHQRFHVEIENHSNSSRFLRFEILTSVKCDTTEDLRVTELCLRFMFFYIVS